MRLADSFPLPNAAPPPSAPRCLRRHSAPENIERGARSDISKDGKRERERKFVLYCACNLIERFFNETKQFDGICDVGETNLS